MMHDSADSLGSTNLTKSDIEDENVFVAPLFVFLASSLNVELVYIILTSICQFAHTNQMNETKLATEGKSMVVEEVENEDESDKSSVDERDYGSFINYRNGT